MVVALSHVTRKCVHSVIKAVSVHRTISGDIMSMDYNARLRNATRKKLRILDSFRGTEVRSAEFWDVVLVTAVDQSQKEAYELQIRDKLMRKEIPLGVHYKVLSDPPGPKIGNGGSTLYALQSLSDTFGNALSGLRVLLIHAGGYSQRLPSASALGKVFMALPLGEPVYQMLELKLAMYVDFPSQMKPGVLVTCADDIELYSITEDEQVMFDQPGFTALAHPSPLSVGTGHGVFVLDQHEEFSNSEMKATSCLRFLHKPSINKMQDSGAVFERGSRLSSEFVYTDSTYYIDFATVKSLLNLLEELGPLDCEIDAYGDFLQALGPQATIDYTNNTANVTKEESNLVEIRQKIFNHLKGTPLNVILLNNSKFYHIGTTSEYIFHLTEDEALRAELGLMSSAFSLHEEQNWSACVIHSILDPSSSVGAGSVVEYSRLGKGASVGRGSIVSGCCISPGLSVPDGAFIHLLCIKHQEQTKYVTVFFGINDDLKRSVRSPCFLEDLNLFGISLANCLPCWEIETECLRFSGDSSSCNVWNACLFPICSDQQSSLSASLQMLQAILTGSNCPLPADTKLASMWECLQWKNLEEMLNLRIRLHEAIRQKRCD